MARRKSAIQQHVENLRALDRQFRQFDKVARRTLRDRRDLRRLLVELKKLERAIKIPAFGFQ
jgi:hypothetical protein